MSQHCHESAGCLSDSGLVLQKVIRIALLLTTTDSYVYYEVLDHAVAAVQDRFDQPGYRMYQNLQEMIIQGLPW